MTERNISIQDRSKLFAVRVIKAYVELNKRHFDDAGKVLSKQFLRSGTSIGANVAEAEFAQSNADFISKYSIALKEASETIGYADSTLRNNGGTLQRSLDENNDRVATCFQAKI